jgi:hypothetical protein
MSETVQRLRVIPDNGTATTDQSIQLGSELRKLGAPPSNRFAVERPRLERPDRIGWLGPRRSKELQAHDAREATVYYRAREAETLVRVGTAIEHAAFQHGTDLARAYETKLAELDPDSMTGAFAEMLALDSLARTRERVTEVMADFKSQTRG